MSAPTTSKLITRLSDAGLVSRGANESDSRSSFVALTDSGARTAVALFESGDLMMAELLNDWSPRDVSALTRLMHRLAETVTTAHPSPENATQHN
jgi:DNA-binding MarR family transcriptional regulator